MAKMKISRFQKYSPTFSFQSLQIMNIVTIFINIAVWFLAFLHFFFKFESIIPKFAVWFASVRRISVSGPKMRAIQGPEPAIRRADIRRVSALQRKFSLASGMQKRPKTSSARTFSDCFSNFQQNSHHKMFLNENHWQTIF